MLLRVRFGFPDHRLYGSDHKLRTASSSVMGFQLASEYVWPGRLARSGLMMTANVDVMTTRLVTARAEALRMLVVLWIAGRGGS